MGWLRRIFGLIAKPKLQPEMKFVLSMTDTEIGVTDPDGVTRTIGKDAIGAVIIETNDTGPWGMDVWWIILDQDGKLGTLYPQGATNENLVMDWLMALPGFDHASMTDAMQCTDNATFPVWARAHASG